MNPSLATFDTVAFGDMWHSLTPNEQRSYVRNLSPEQAHFILNLWEVRARPKQLAPKGDWRFWVLLAGRGFGKAQPLDTPIPTPSGWTTIGELKLGDQVFDESGKPCAVKTLFNIHTPEIAYRVHFSDGTTLDACADHEWVTWDHVARKAYLRSPYEDATHFPDDWVNWKLGRIVGGNYLAQPVVDAAIALHSEGMSVCKVALELNVSRVALAPHIKAGHFIERTPKIYPNSPCPKIRTTQEILETLTQGGRSNLNHSIPQAFPLDLPSVDLPIPPYTLGAWLGDGTSNSGSFTQDDADSAFLREQIEIDGFATTTTSTKCSFGTLGLRKILSKNDLIQNKHIPDIYLRASVAQRLALLQGLMDTDGTASKSGHCEFVNTNERIARGVYELIVSLGMRATWVEKTPTLNGIPCAVCYRITFIPTMPVFRLHRKLLRLSFDRSQALRKYHRMIVKVERIVSVPMRCIQVDSPNHMYLAGRAMIPTHNSVSIVQWAHRQAMSRPGSIGALVASTAADVRDVLVSGPSGILNVTPIHERPHHSPTYRRLDWANGSSALLFSADEPERFRGPQYHWAICDEFASWRRPESFTQMLFGLRLQDAYGDPRCAIATTPKPVKHLRELLARKGVKKTAGTTYENRDNLAPAWFEEIITQYEGSNLGKQELMGILLDDMGSLWSSELIQQHRVIYPEVVPELDRVLIAVDPAVTSNEESSETGIIVGGVAKINRIKHCYILDDLSCKASPETWGNIVVNAYRDTMADGVVVEVNNGGDLVKANIHAIDPTVNVIEVRASKGKVSRAEPVVNYYEQGKVHHDGVFVKLEQQQTEWAVGAKSPDRLDALVWCVTALMSNDDQSPVYRQVRARFAQSPSW